MLSSQDASGMDFVVRIHETPEDPLKIFYEQIRKDMKALSREVKEKRRKKAQCKVASKAGCCVETGYITGLYFSVRAAATTDNEGERNGYGCLSAFLIFGILLTPMLVYMRTRFNPLPLPLTTARELCIPRQPDSSISTLLEEFNRIIPDTSNVPKYVEKRKREILCLGLFGKNPNPASSLTAFSSDPLFDKNLISLINSC